MTTGNKVNEARAAAVRKIEEAMAVANVFAAHGTDVTQLKALLVMARREGIEHLHPPEPTTKQDELSEFHECSGCGLNFHESELSKTEGLEGWWCGACDES